MDNSLFLHNQNQKNNIRLEKRAARKNLTPQNRAYLSQLIAQQIQQNIYIAPAAHVGVYLPIDNEVDTKYIVDYLTTSLKCHIYIPKIIDQRNMIFEHYFCVNKESNVYRVVPQTRNILDYYIVPMVAFDQFFNRIGFGKGYYDYYFSKYAKGSILIGVAFSFQQTESILIGPFDKKMDIIVTEQQVFKSHGPQ